MDTIDNMNPSELIASVIGTGRYKIDTIIKLLLTKNIITKEEYNKTADEIMNSMKEYPEVDAETMDKLKEGVFLK